MAAQKRQAEDNNEYVPSKKARTTKANKTETSSTEASSAKTPATTIPWCTKCGVPATARHLRTKAHTGLSLRDFKCGGCPRAFARKDQVSRHVQNYTGDDCSYVNQYRRKPCATLLKAVVLPSVPEDSENTEDTDEAEPSSPEGSTSVEAGTSSRDQGEYLEDSTSGEEKSEDDGKEEDDKGQDEDTDVGFSSAFESADETDEEMSPEPVLVNDSPRPSLPIWYYWDLWLPPYESNASSSSEAASTSTVRVTSGVLMSGSNGFNDTLPSLPLRDLFDIDKYAKDFGL